MSDINSIPGLPADAVELPPDAVDVTPAAPPADAAPATAPIPGLPADAVELPPDAVEIPSTPASAPDSTPAEPGLMSKAAHAVGEFFRPAHAETPVEERYSIDRGRRDVTPDEIQQIAAKRGVDPQWLRAHADYFDAQQDPSLDDSIGEQAAATGRRFVGKVNAKLPANVANLVAHHFAGLTPEQQDALDDVRGMVDAKQGLLEKAADIGTSFVVPMGGAAKVAKAAKLGGVATAALSGAEMAAQGAGMGYAGARRGEEEHEARVGAVIGPVFGAILHGGAAVVGKAAERLGLTGDAARAAESAARDLESEASAKLAARAPEERALEDVVIQNHEARAAAQDGRADDVVAALEPAERSSLETLAKDTGYAPRAATGDDPALAHGVAELVSDHADALDRALGVGAGKAESLGEAITLHGDAFVRKTSRAERLGAELAEVLDRHSVELAGQTGRPIGQLIRKVKAIRSTIGDYDSRLGQQLLPHFDNLVTGLSRADAATRDAALAIKGVLSAARSAGAGGSAGFDLFSAAERGAAGMDSLTPKQAEAVRSVAGFFRAEREAGIAKGVPIEELAGISRGEGYIPHAALPAGDAALALEREAKALRIPFTDDTALAHLVAHADANETSREAQFLEALSYATGRDLERAPPTELRAAMNSLSEPATLPMRRASAAPSAGVVGAVRQRGAGVPDLIRDTNLPRLMLRYSSAINRAAFTREPLAELAARARALHAVAPEAETRIANLIRDVAGGRLDTVKRDLGSRAAAWSAQQRVLAERATGPAEKAYHATAAVLPELLNFMAKQIYPYALGLRADIAVRHLMQPLSLALPELGHVRGAKYLGAALVDLGRSLASPGALMAEMRARGLTDSQLPADVMAAVRHGLDSSPLRRFGSEALEGMNRVFMLPLHGALVTSRAIAMKMADAVSVDVMRDPEFARYVTTRVDESLRPALSRMLAANDTEGVQKLVATWLSQKSYLNFGPASASEWGREAGSFFTSFSSFPVAALSDLAKPFDKWASRGAAAGNAEALRVVSKYVPLLALAAAVHQKWNDAVEASPALGKVIGRDSYKQLSPLEVVSYLRKGGPLAAPAVQAATGLIDLVENPSSIPRAMHSALLQAVPANALIRFLANDVPEMGGPELPGAEYFRRPKKGD